MTRELLEGNRARAIALRAEQTANVAKLLRGVHGRHIARLEGAILRYQAAIQDVLKDADAKTLVAKMHQAARPFVVEAVKSGYTRALIDLRARKWIIAVDPDVQPPQSVINSILDENVDYLVKFSKAYPDLSPAAAKARAAQYGHFLWRAAERAYTQCLKDFAAFLAKQRNVKESVVNPNAITRTATVWLPANKVAQLPGMMSEHSQDLVDETRVNSMAEKIKSAGGYDASKLARILLMCKDNGSLHINDGNHRARGAAKALGDKLIPTTIEYYGKAGLREGGAGSGNFNHVGRKGQVGGSGASSHSKIAGIYSDGTKLPPNALDTFETYADESGAKIAVAEAERVARILGIPEPHSVVIGADNDAPNAEASTWHPVDSNGGSDPRDLADLLVNTNVVKSDWDTGIKISGKSDLTHYSYTPQSIKTYEDYLKVTVDHEMGHVWMYNMSSADRDEWTNIYSHSASRWNSKLYGGYGKHDSWEMFAEATVAYTHGEGAKLPKPIYAFIDKRLSGKSLLESIADSHDMPIAFSCDRLGCTSTRTHANGAKSQYVMPRELREADDDDDDDSDDDTPDFNAYFVGPDDDETCDGCEDAVNNNPYTVDTVPEPGEFECGSRCRHMVQLDGDAPDDLAPYSYHGKVGFGKADSDDAKAKDDSEDDDEAAEEDPLTSEQLFALTPWELAAHDLTPDQIASYIDHNDYDLDDIADFCDPEELFAIGGAMSPYQLDDLDDLLTSGDPEDVMGTLISSPELFDAFVGMGVEGFDDEVEAFTCADGLAQYTGSDYRVFFGEDGKYYVTDDVAKLKGTPLKESGNENSGDHGHAGRPGERGGSAGSIGIVAFKGQPDNEKLTFLRYGRTSYVVTKIAAPEKEETVVDETKRNSAITKVNLGLIASGIVRDGNGNMVNPGTLAATFQADDTLGKPSIIYNMKAFDQDAKTIGDGNPDKYTVGAKYAKDAEDYLRMTVDHEMGHAYQLSLPRNMKREWDGLFSKYAIDIKQPPDVSRYAATDSRESFAENYSAYLNNLPQPLVFHDFFARASVLGDKHLRESAADEPIAFICGFGCGPTIHLYADGTRKTINAPKLREGGPGSGNFGHAGRKGEVGGSAGTDLPHDTQIEKYFNTPEVAKEIQHLSVAASAKAITFNGVLYHALEDPVVAHAIANGETSFYNSQTGYYGAGLYFSTEPITGEGWSKPGDPFAVRTSYGNERFDTVVSARLCVFSDEEYTQHVTEFCHAVYHDMPIKTEQYEIGQRLMTECLRHQGFDGIEITNPYGKEGVDYVADFNAGHTIKSITLHEAADDGPKLVVLFDDSTIAPKTSTWHDERPFED